MFLKVDVDQNAVRAVWHVDTEVLYWNKTA